MQEFEQKKYLWNKFQFTNLHQYIAASTAQINQKKRMFEKFNHVTDTSLSKLTDSIFLHINLWGMWYQITGV